MESIPSASQWALLLFLTARTESDASYIVSRKLKVIATAYFVLAYPNSLVRLRQDDIAVRMRARTFHNGIHDVHR